jgi:hypothetical protein
VVDDQATVGTEHLAVKLDNFVPERHAWQPVIRALMDRQRRVDVAVNLPPSEHIIDIFAGDL